METGPYSYPLEFGCAAACGLTQLRGCLSRVVTAHVSFDLPKLSPDLPKTVGDTRIAMRRCVSELLASRRLQVIDHDRDEEIDHNEYSDDDETGIEDPRPGIHRGRGRLDFDPTFQGHD